MSNHDYGKLIQQSEHLKENRPMDYEEPPRDPDADIGPWLLATVIFVYTCVILSIGAFVHWVFS